MQQGARAAANWQHGAVEMTENGFLHSRSLQSHAVTHFAFLSIPIPKFKSYIFLFPWHSHWIIPIFIHPIPDRTQQNNTVLICKQSTVEQQKMFHWKNGHQSFKD